MICTIKIVTKVRTAEITFIYWNKILCNLNFKKEFIMTKKFEDT